MFISFKFRYMSLPDLSKSCLGKDLAITSKNSKAMSARVSYWKREELRPDQVIINVCFVYLLPPANEVSQVSVCHSVGGGGELVHNMHHGIGHKIGHPPALSLSPTLPLPLPWTSNPGTYPHPFSPSPTTDI